MKALTKDMATKDTMWIHISMTQLGRSHEKYKMELRYDKKIAIDQYKVGLCDIIYISEIVSMMTILEYPKNFK
jgi:hypothetical protein